jgi:hypothetical protein
MEEAAMASEGSARRVLFSFHPSSRQVFIAAALLVGALALGAGAAALIVRLSPAPAPSAAEATAHRQALPLLPEMAPDSPNRAPPAQTQVLAGYSSAVAPAQGLRDEPAQGVLPPARANPSPLLRPLAPPTQPKLASLPPPADAPLPPPRPLALSGPAASPAGPFDRWTAVYVLTAHKVYLPDGTQLEAHSGLGDRLDNPRYVDEPDRGATPPHLYDLTMREGLFHGVQALRLNPIGGESAIFGRVGLLAHPYMLGPTGDSNGCVSFKDYDAFLAAFQSGKVKRLAVVASLT